MDRQSDRNGEGLVRMDGVGGGRGVRFVCIYCGASYSSSSFSSYVFSFCFFCHFDVFWRVHEAEAGQLGVATEH